MKSISNNAELKSAIETLELDRAIRWELLKEQFYVTYESLKPANLILSTLKDVVTSPNLIDNVLGTVMGIGSGYLLKKAVVGASGNIFRKVLGSVLQYGVTNQVSQHSDSIVSIGKLLFQKIFHKKEKVDEEAVD